MCYRPLHIFNPKQNPTYRDRVYLDVPCGKCAECQKRVRNDWFVRAFFQWKETVDVYHGTVMYVTLTFSNACLPLTQSHEPCFDKRKVQLFLKRFRMAVKRKFKLPFAADIRYFITSEYGTGTQRPHHHGILYFNFPVSIVDFYCLRKLVENTWEYGFVSFGRKLTNIRVRGMIQSPAALSYVCKYIQKDMNFPFDKTDKVQQPFHLQSQHFGEYMIEHFNLRSGDSFSLGCLIDGTFLLSGSLRFPYAIPQYITRKVLFDYHYERKLEVIHRNGYDIEIKKNTISYTLNDLGRKVMKQREFHSIDMQKSQFDSFLSEENIYNLMSNNVISDIVTSRVSYRYTPEDIVDFVVSTYGSWSPDQLTDFVVYTRIFKDRIVIPHAGYFTGVADDYRLSDVLMYLDEIYDNDEYVQLSVDSEKEDALGTYQFRNSLYHRLYNHSLPYANQDVFELLLQIYNAIAFALGKIDEDRIVLERQNEYNSKLLRKEVI